MSDPVPSPCIRHCTLDDQQVCIGCYRTIDDIVAWSSLGNEARREGISRAGERRQQGSLKGS